MLNELLAVHSTLMQCFPRLNINGISIKYWQYYFRILLSNNFIAELLELFIYELFKRIELELLIIRMLKVLL